MSSRVVLATRNAGKIAELQRILANVRVDSQRHTRAWLTDGVKRRERHLDVVADAAHVDDEPLHVFFEERAGQMGDHGACRRDSAESGTWRQLVRRRDPRVRASNRAIGPCECAWQIATASASAASCGAGTLSSPSSILTICPSCGFCARP